MDRNDLMTIAKTLNDELKTLTKRKLYVSSFFYGASVSDPVKRPDRICVEGIKNLRSTGRFTYDDRAAINAIIRRHCDCDGLNIKLLTDDWGMHNAVITLK